MQGALLGLHRTSQNALQESCTVNIVTGKFDARTQCNLMIDAVAIELRIHQLFAVPTDVPTLDHRVAHAARVEIGHALPVTLLGFAIHASGMLFGARRSIGRRNPSTNVVPGGHT